jgi:tRNA pseudouridine synthase 10
MSRKKIIHKMTCEEVNDHMIILDLTTQAGTYIKEFIHGDLGRTLPNFSTIIGSNADILQLDVLAINSEFPPITSK